MKQKFLKIGSFLMVTAAMLVAFSTTSCTKDSTLDVNPAAISDVAAEGAQDLVLKIESNTSWTITVDKDWVQFTEKTGSKNKDVKFNVIANEGAERTATITVKTDDGEVSQTRTIKQLGAAVELPAPAGEITGPSEGEGSVELTAPAIDRADTYVWYKDGVVIPSAAANKYVATESGKYQVAGKNVAGEGEKSPEKNVTITEVPAPGPAGAITGPTSGEGSVELTAPAIENATTYAWYKDGSKIPSATANKYTVTESGKYQVAGVNKVGVEGTKSPEHEVTIGGGGGDGLIDELVGTYEVFSIFVNSKGAYMAEHEAVIVKESSNTVKIKYFLGIDTLFGEELGTNKDEITATVDGTSLTLAHKATTFEWNVADYDANYIAPARESTYCDNADLPFPVYTIVGTGNNISIDFTDPDGYAQTIDGTPYNASCIIMAESGGECLGAFGNFAGTEFYKVSSSTSLAPYKKSSGNSELKKMVPTYRPTFNVR